jgi:hypothetical protein
VVGRFASRLWWGVSLRICQDVSFVANLQRAIDVGDSEGVFIDGVCRIWRERRLEYVDRTRGDFSNSGSRRLKRKGGRMYYVVLVGGVGCVQLQMF